MADIFLSSLDRSEVYKLPIIPEDLPDLERSINSEEFETNRAGIYSFQTTISLLTFTIESFLPAYSDKYSWSKGQINPASILNLINTSMAYKKPIRVVMDRNENKDMSKTVINIACTIESFSYRIAKNQDIYYSLSLKEWREV